ncbi:hypothetical protein BU15DRAFT_53881 [Melanogaster broomeanus]|nr:hypothetical protein BU15DRAFT_53881 [Melanogaster broomeanus]
MYRKISRDVKLAAINLYEHHHLSLEDLLARMGFSESTFWCILRLWHETGNVVKHTHGVHSRLQVISFASFAIDPNGFWMNCSTFSKQIASYPPTTLLSIKNLNELVSLSRNSSESQKRETTNVEWTSLSI